MAANHYRKPQADIDAATPEVFLEPGAQAAIRAQFATNPIA